MFLQVDRVGLIASRLTPTEERISTVGVSLLAIAICQTPQELNAKNKNARRDAWHFV
jgi:hypothetical protein